MELAQASPNLCMSLHSYTGGKKSKEQLHFCCDASRNEKLKPFVIFTSLKPCFKNVKPCDESIMLTNKPGQYKINLVLF